MSDIIIDLLRTYLRTIYLIRKS